MKDLSRREFLKTIGVLAGGLILGGRDNIKQLAGYAWGERAPRDPDPSDWSDDDLAALDIMHWVEGEDGCAESDLALITAWHEMSEAEQEALIAAYNPQEPILADVYLE